MRLQYTMALSNRNQRMCWVTLSSELLAGICDLEPQFLPPSNGRVVTKLTALGVLGRLKQVINEKAF